MRHVLIIVSLGLIHVFASACVTQTAARGQPMTADEIKTHGTRTFHSPYPRVFKAGMAALTGQGYELAYIDPEGGIVRTKRKLIRTVARAGAGQAAATVLTRQYTLMFVRVGEDQTQVSAKPQVFIGEQDVSQNDSWVLEGPQGERQLWKQLFEEIQMLCPQHNNTSADPKPSHSI